MFFYQFQNLLKLFQAEIPVDWQEQIKDAQQAKEQAERKLTAKNTELGLINEEKETLTANIATQKTRITELEAAVQNKDQQIANEAAKYQDYINPLTLKDNEIVKNLLKEAEDAKENEIKNIYATYKSADEYATLEQQKDQELTLKNAELKLVNQAKRDLRKERN